MICAALFEARYNLSGKKLKEIEMKFEFQKPI